MGERATELSTASRENVTRYVFSGTYGWEEEFSQADPGLFGLNKVGLNQLGSLKKKNYFTYYLKMQCLIYSEITLNK